MKHLFGGLAIAILAAASACAADSQVDDVLLAVHGGAGVSARDPKRPEAAEEYRQALRAALLAGQAELQKKDGTSLDAVVAAIKLLEDSPLFNAGKGAAFTRDGRIELDASLMAGRTRRAGAVAAVTTIKNPIVAARLVMEQSPHVLLVGGGAEAFAREHGAEIVDSAYFRTERRWKSLQNELHKEKGDKSNFQQCFGTVGCVAVDGQGNLAAGTSTGGITAKLSGRVGDTPLIGAGTFADNESCAVSATGHGEYFIRAVAAHDIAALVEYKGLSVGEASRIVIHDKIRRAGGDGGVIVLDRKGRLAMTYSSHGMYRGYVTRSGQVRVMIFDD